MRCVITAKYIIINLQGRLIHPVIAAQIESDLDLARKCVQEVAEAVSYPRDAPKPAVWDAKLIYSTSGERRQVAATMGSARRAMVDLLGWLSWMASLYDLSGAEISDEAKWAIHTTFGLLTAIRRGVLIALRRDWQQVNIPHLVAHHVPVVYPWTIWEATSERFARLSPQWLQAFDLDNAKPGETMPRRYETHEPRPENTPNDGVHANVKLYDDYLQKIDPVARPGITLPVNDDTTWRTYVVDYEGWAARVVDDALLISEYLRYYSFTEYLSADGGVRYIHRFRPVAESSAPKSPQEKNAARLFWKKEKEREAGIREIGRFRYAPQALARGESDDEVACCTPGSSPTPPSGSEGAFSGRPSSRGSRPSSSTSGGSRAERRSASSPYSLLRRIEGPIARGRELPLLARLGSPTRAATEQDQQSEESDADEDEDSDGMADEFWVKAVHFIERARAEQTQRALKKAGGPEASDAKIPDIRTPEETQFATTSEAFAYVNSIVRHHTFDGPLLPIDSSIEWSDADVENARLRLPDPSAEVRMCHWVQMEGGSMNLDQLLLRAIERCLEFRVEIPIERAREFVPDELTPLELGATTFHEVGYVETFYDANLDCYQLRDNYTATVLTLLTRPHARAFLFLGGIKARLARHFGGNDLLMRAVYGPSPLVSHHLRGRVTHEKSTTIDDRVCEAEEWLLLGRVKGVGRRTADRWIWPPPSLLHDSWIFNGEWNQYAENWFQKYLRLFVAGRVFAKTYGEWKQYLHHEKPTPTHPPLTTKSWRILKSHIDSKSQAWNDARIVDLFSTDV
ncbi:hypothetical protein PLICRDRAFT_174464 [Plicaturopsis crispa FD-325 SS-3]|nr:hypothetical protein PLICRDRAFT_174464 [Plicaturopsis crispa FD-325 SS-3]